MADNTKLKKCKKKIYEIWVCKPPTGTCVINKLEQAAVVQQCKGRTYFTADEMAQFKASNVTMYNFLCQHADVTSEKRPFVLCGTMGEMWATGANNIAKTYVFASDDSEITPESLQKRAGATKGILDWTRVRTKADSAECYAQFVPLPQMCRVQTAWGSILTANDPRVKVHGKGDFILYEMLPNGQPNENDKRVVNGAVFKNTYNNIGWTSCLSDDNYEIVTDSSKFPKLCQGASTGNDFSGMVRDFVNKVEQLETVKSFNSLAFFKDMTAITVKDIASAKEFLKICQSVVAHIKKARDEWNAADCRFRYQDLCFQAKACPITHFLAKDKMDYGVDIDISEMYQDLTFKVDMKRTECTISTTITPTAKTLEWLDKGVKRYVIDEEAKKTAVSTSRDITNWKQVPNYADNVGYYVESELEEKVYRFKLILSQVLREDKHRCNARLSTSLIASKLMDRVKCFDTTQFSAKGGEQAFLEAVKKLEEVDKQNETELSRVYVQVLNSVIEQCDKIQEKYNVPCTITNHPNIPTRVKFSFQGVINYVDEVFNGAYNGLVKDLEVVVDSESAKVIAIAKPAIDSSTASIVSTLAADTNYKTWGTIRGMLSYGESDTFPSMMDRLGQPEVLIIADALRETAHSYGKLNRIASELRAEGKVPDAKAEVSESENVEVAEDIASRGEGTTEQSNKVTPNEESLAKLVSAMTVSVGGPTYSNLALFSNKIMCALLPTAGNLAENEQFRKYDSSLKAIYERIKQELDAFMSEKRYPVAGGGMWSIEDTLDIVSGMSDTEYQYITQDNALVTQLHTYLVQTCFLSELDKILKNKKLIKDIKLSCMLGQYCAQRSYTLRFVDAYIVEATKQGADISANNIKDLVKHHASEVKRIVEEYLENPDKSGGYSVSILETITNYTGSCFKCADSLAEEPVVEKENGVAKLTIKNTDNDTTVVTFKDEDPGEIRVQCKAGGVSVNNLYKLSLVNNLDFTAMKIYIDICRALKVHPWKFLLTPRATTTVMKAQQEQATTGSGLLFCNLHDFKTKGAVANYKVDVRDAKGRNLGERTVAIKLNYVHFDIEKGGYVRLTDEQYTNTKPSENFEDVTLPYITVKTRGIEEVYEGKAYGYQMQEYATLLGKIATDLRYKYKKYNLDDTDNNTPTEN